MRKPAERPPDPPARPRARRKAAPAAQDARPNLLSSDLGLRLGFFPAFEGADSVLLHGTVQQVYSLVPRLFEFVASPLLEWPVHEHALVSRRRPARLFLSRLGMSSRDGFRWRCSPAELASIQALFQALAVSGSGHRVFELAGSPVRLIVSANEYPDTWWHQHA